MSNAPNEWLRRSDEPWTRYRTLVDLAGQAEDAPDVQEARRALLTHPRVQALILAAGEREDRPIKRHNDATHPLVALGTLADFGLRADDAAMTPLVSSVLAHQSPEGAFESLVNIPQAFGGTGEDLWTWVLCDAPTLLYALLSFGMEDDWRVQRAAAHLAGLVETGGWRCVAAPALGRFRGPGRKTDPCPIANVIALKALSLAPAWRDTPATRAGAEAVLGCWQRRATEKPYLFGMGTDFRKLKYPLMWYDILHVTDVLSRFPFVHADTRFREMLAIIQAQADNQGRYIAGSMYQAWKGWSFADKKQPSPWLTFLIWRIACRTGV